MELWSPVLLPDSPSSQGRSIYISARQYEQRHCCSRHYPSRCTSPSGILDTAYITLRPQCATRGRKCSSSHTGISREVVPQMEESVRSVTFPGAHSSKSSKLYNFAGDVVYLKLFRTPALVLNSLGAARDLLDKRSGKYSDRPRMVMLAEL